MADNTKTGKAGAAAALPKAVLLALPGAASMPVAQQRRAGRLPKTVASLRTARQARCAVVRVFELRAQLDFVRQAKRENFEEFQRNNATLRELEKRIADTRPAYEEMAKREEQLVEELLLMGVRAQTYLEFLNAMGGQPCAC